jgi:hypothetical protein
MAPTVHTAASALISYLQRISSVGYALSAIPDTPKRTPRKLWLQVEVLGPPWSIGGQ